MPDLISLIERFEKQTIGCPAPGVRDPGANLGSHKPETLQARYAGRSSNILNDKERSLAWREAFRNYAVASAAFVSGAGGATAAGADVVLALFGGGLSVALTGKTEDELANLMLDNLLMGSVSSRPSSPLTNLTFASRFKDVLELIRGEAGPENVQHVYALFALLKEGQQSSSARRIALKFQGFLQALMSEINSLAEFNRAFSENKLSLPLAHRIGTVLRDNPGARLLSKVGSDIRRITQEKQSLPNPTSATSEFLQAGRNKTAVSKTPADLRKAKLPELTDDDLRRSVPYLEDTYAHTAREFLGAIETPRVIKFQTVMLNEHATRIAYIAKTVVPRLKILEEAEKLGLSIPPSVTPTFHGDLAFNQLTSTQWNLIGVHLNKNSATEEILKVLKRSTDQIRSRMWEAPTRTEVAILLYRFEQLKTWLKNVDGKTPEQVKATNELKSWIANSTDKRVSGMLD